ncbi:MAG: antibiotic biosynthesis monooxygenase family protein [Nocardioidaceae bacterium]
MADTRISTEFTGITLINVFTVEPDRQAELVDTLARATREVMQDLPGFISANLHTGVDGTHVANYAQWESHEHFQSMLANPTAREHMAACSAIASFEPALYTVASTHARP